MKDNLEQYIFENRKAFDDKEPNALIWSEIERKLDGPSDKSTYAFSFLLKIAASAIVILCTGLLIGLQIGKSGGNSYPVSNSFAEFAETENYFKQQVKYKEDELKNYNMEESVSDDLSQLDAVYEELKNELLSSQNNNKETIIEALILNYQTKIEILEKVLKKSTENNLKDINNEENITI